MIYNQLELSLLRELLIIVLEKEVITLHELANSIYLRKVYVIAII